MTARTIVARPLTAQAFAPFGDVIAATGAPDFQINGGMCDRFHDRARMDFTGDGRAGISVGFGRPYALPLSVTMVERHPLGSQAFVPLSPQPFLVVVAGGGGRPAPHSLRAFVSAPGQGVSYHRGTWHHPLLALGEVSDFLVVDRGGPGHNCDEVELDPEQPVFVAL